MRLKTAWHLLRQDRSGNIAVVFAFALIPVMLCAGAAIDFSRGTLAKAELQLAVDGASLYAADAFQNGDEQSEVEAQVEVFLDTNVSAVLASGLTFDVEHDASAGTTTVAATSSIPATFMQLMSISVIEVAATSTSVNGTDAIEIALVLDNTGSMASSGKLAALKTAAKAMIATLAETEVAQEDKAYVALVPFSVPVNVGTASSSASWLGDAETETTCTTSGRRRTCTTAEKSWGGCVGDRASPNTAVAGTPTGSSDRYPRYYDTCSIAPLTPLTNDLDSVSDAIDDMIASGATNLPIGIVWGWNMLTPGAPLSEAVEETDEEAVSRYMIVLTDGENTKNTLSSSVSKIDELTEDACEGAKDDDITVFTIRVIEGNEDILEACATSESYYYDVSNTSTLDDVFDLILKNITKLRIQS